MAGPSGLGGVSEEDLDKDLWWKKECEYVGCSSNLHLTKILLGRVMPGRCGLEVYRLFLQHRLSMHQDLIKISELQDGLLREFFRESHPTQSPKYFSLFDNLNNLSRLEYLVGARIVLLRQTKSRHWTIVHDRSVFELLRPRSMRTLVFVLKRCEKKRPGKGRSGFFDVYLAPHRLGADPIQDLSNKGYISEAVLQPSGRCLYQVVAHLLRASLKQGHEHGPHCESLARLVSGKARLEAELQVPFILVSHVRSPLYSRSQLKESFAVLSIVGEPDEAKHQVLGVTHHGVLYRYKTEKKPLFNMLRETQRRLPGSEPALEGLTKTRASAPAPPPPPVCQCEPCLNASSFKRNIKEAPLSALYRIQLPVFDLLEALGQSSVAARELILRACDTSCCGFDLESFSRPVEGDDDEEDEALQVPVFSEVRKSRRVYARHQLALVGFGSYARIQSTEREEGESGCVILGSWAQGGEDEGPCDLVGSFMQEMLTTRDALVKQKRELLKELTDWVASYKKAHLEFCLRLEPSLPPEDPGSSDTDTASEESEPDDSASESGEDDELLDQLNRDMSRLEAEALEQLDLLEEKRFTRGNLRSRSIARKETRALASWKKTLWGRLERALERLILACFVVGFNSSGFDLPLIGSDLILEAKKRRLRGVRLQRDGNKIVGLKFDGIEMVDLKRMLSGGYSLEALGKVCGLKEDAKCLFPFSKFDRLGFLAEPRLPESALDWVNTLNPSKSPSQAEVDEALALFDRLGCSSVGSYLSHYLEKDVLLTVKSTCILFRTFYELMGVHPVESRKLTISSFSALGMQAQLLRSRRPGFRSCSDHRVFSVRRCSARCGVEPDPVVLFPAAKQRYEGRSDRRGPERRG